MKKEYSTIAETARAKISIAESSMKEGWEIFAQLHTAIDTAIAEALEGKTRLTSTEFSQITDRITGIPAKILNIEGQKKLQIKIVQLSEQMDGIFLQIADSAQDRQP